MKNLIFRLLAIACCVWAINAYGKILLDPPPEVPTNLDAQTFKELTDKRNGLLTQFGETQEKVDAQARDCHDVEEGSPKVAKCMTKAADVKIVVRNYRSALARFHEEIAAGVAWKQAASNLDAKLTMPAAHNARPITIESHGEFYIVAPDGRKLSNQEAAHLTEDDEARLVTGSGGEALLTLADGTHIKLGSNTEYLTKVADPNKGSDEQAAMQPDSNSDIGKPTVAELVKGTLRWVHEESSEMIKKLNESASQNARRDHHRLHMVHVVVAERGTDFECLVLPNGSGHIKLFTGEISVTSKLTGADVTLTHGQMITFTKYKVGTVMPIPSGI